MRDRLLSLMSASILIAIVSYITLSAVPLFAQTQLVTFEVYEHSVSQKMPISGVFLREEQGFISEEAFLSEHLEGQKLARGYEITANLAIPVGGIFTTYTDGYEHLSKPSRLTPSAISEIESLKKTSSFSGKIISDIGWLYACVDAENAKLLEVGEEYEIFNPYFGDIAFRLDEIGETANEETALKLSLVGESFDTIYLRGYDGELYIGNFSGLYVPKNAVYEIDGEEFVTKLVLGSEEQVSVERVYDGGDFLIIDSSELFSGNEVLEINSEDRT